MSYPDTVVLIIHEICDLVALSIHLALQWTVELQAFKKNCTLSTILVYFPIHKKYLLCDSVRVCSDGPILCLHAFRIGHRVIHRVCMDCAITIQFLHYSSNTNNVGVTIM